MKKIIISLSYLKFFAITLLLVACGNANDGNKSSDVQSPASGESAVETKASDIAFIKLDTIVQRYDLFHDLRREFEQKKKKKEDEFQSKVRTFQNDAKTFKEKFDKMLLTTSQAEEQSRLLEQRELKLQEEANQINTALGEEETVLYRQIMDAIQKHIEKYNAEKKYSLILNAAAIMTGNPSMDITAEILKGLNEEYIANKGK
ncbi:MAG: OmpH family outer membrane protein [Prevotellaceae bacterium]|jgi:outer membrane protein|nr:OmpH family outer membrane protein [Prevotellaceae bacterium]